MYMLRYYGTKQMIKKKKYYLIIEVKVGQGIEVFISRDNFYRNIVIFSVNLPMLFI